MSGKAVAWTLLSAIAFATVLLFNHWASYQPLSTLLYAGIVLALCGLANIVASVPLSGTPETLYRSADSLRVALP